MSGKVESGQLVAVEPVAHKEIKVGSVVLCKVNGVQYLHLVKAISGDRSQIGNNRGRINGWTNRRNIFGLVTEITDWALSFHKRSQSQQVFIPSFRNKIEILFDLFDGTGSEFERFSRPVFLLRTIPTVSRTWRYLMIE